MAEMPHRTFKDRLFLFFGGMCMGAADLVPGISGGTMAFILGFYEDLIHSIKNFNWRFLLIVIAGIMLAMGTLAKVIHGILGHEIQRVYLYASFLGLILGSAIFCARQIRCWRPIHILWLLGGITTAYFLTKPVAQSVPDTTLYSVHMPVEIGAKNVDNYDSDTQMLINLSKSTVQVMRAKGILDAEGSVVNQQTDVAVPLSSFEKDYTFQYFKGWTMLCGAISVCAMLLPGISGSYILVILGMYTVVIGALADFITGLQQYTFDMDAFFTLANLGVGILMGALLFSRLISWLLVHHHSRTIAALTGFMLGALRAVWPFRQYSYSINPLKIQEGPQLIPSTFYIPDMGSSFFWKSALFALLGFVLVFVLERIAKRN